jgi:hypothetical protein
MHNIFELKTLIGKCCGNKHHNDYCLRCKRKYGKIKRIRWETNKCWSDYYSGSLDNYKGPKERNWVNTKTSSEGKEEKKKS